MLAAPKRSARHSVVLGKTALSASSATRRGFGAAIQIIPTSDKPLEFWNKQKWPVFTPIVGDNWMINTTKLEKTEQGGLLITIEGESFEAETLPMKDTFGALLQVKVADEWVRTELDIGLPLVAKDASVLPSSSPLFGEKEQAAAAEQPKEEQATAPPQEEASAAGAVGMLEAMIGLGECWNIMPCVLPVIAMSFQSGGAGRHLLLSRKRGWPTPQVWFFPFLLALVVVILQSSFGWDLGWGFQFTSEYVIALATIVFVFGLSLFGVLRFPHLDPTKQLAPAKGLWLPLQRFRPCWQHLAPAPFLGTGIGFAFTLPSWECFSFPCVCLFPFLLVRSSRFLSSCRHRCLDGDLQAVYGIYPYCGYGVACRCTWCSDWS